MSDTVRFTAWLIEAQNAGPGDRPVVFTPLALVRAKQLFEGGTKAEECVPALRDEGLLP